MNPKHHRVAERLRTLIAEGESVAQLERHYGNQYTGRRYIREKAPLHEWLVKSENIIQSAFGKDSPHGTHLLKVTQGHVGSALEVDKVVGILRGALSDLEGGFLQHQESLVAGSIFDTVLEQAEYLLKNSFKDPATILGRVVLEDALRRIARSEGVADAEAAKAAFLNETLREKNRYSRPQWRLVQAWLDIGNSAAHGKFSDYSETDVAEMLRGVRRFIAEELR